MNIIGLHPFIPAQDFELSLQFYQDLGFSLVWRDATLARLQCGEHAFFLQNFYVKELAENLTLHLHVSDVAAWWEIAAPLQQQYQLRAEAPADRPWAMRDFTLIDPSGVLWRIAQNI